MFKTIKKLFLIYATLFYYYEENNILLLFDRYESSNEDQNTNLILVHVNITEFDRTFKISL